MTKNIQKIYGSNRIQTTKCKGKIMDSVFKKSIILMIICCIILIIGWALGLPVIPSIIGIYVIRYTGRPIMRIFWDMDGKQTMNKYNECKAEIEKAKTQLSQMLEQQEESNEEQGEYIRDISEQMGIPEPYQTWKVNEKTMLWLMDVKYQPDKTAFVRIIHDDNTFTEEYQIKFKRDKRNEKEYIKLNDDKYYIKGEH